MTLNVKRKDDRGLTITTDGDFGLMIVCQDTTTAEHKSVTNELEGLLGTTPLDIFYQWSMSSIFIFDIKEFNNDLKKQINDALIKIPHMILFDNKKVGGAINKMYVREDKHKVTVGKAYYTLLTYSRGN